MYLKQHLTCSLLHYEARTDGFWDEFCDVEGGEENSDDDSEGDFAEESGEEFPDNKEQVDSEEESELEE